MTKLVAYFAVICVLQVSVFAADNRTDLPYGGSSYELLSTIGQLCKLSQLVAVADVQRVWLDDDAKQLRLDLKLVRVLHGRTPKGMTQLLCDSRLKTSVALGQRVLVFSSRKDFPFPAVNSLLWEFDEASVKESDDAALRLLGHKRGIIHLETNDEGLLSSVVSQYLRHLRGDVRSSSPYMEFLRSLANHSVERIRKDAEADLMVCVRYQSVAQLREMLDDSHIDTKRKDYVRRILEWKLERSTVASNQVARLAEDARTKVERVQKLLNSSDRSKKLRAFAEISRGKKQWAKQHRAAWIEQAAACLNDSDPDVRLSAASAMSAAGDNRAIPHLIKGLNHESIAYRVIMWKNLKAMTGNGVPQYDPRAHTEDRKKSISKVKAWCSKEMLPD